METREILQDIISDFEVGKFVRFFRDKSHKFAPKQESFAQYNDENFKDGKKLGEISFVEAEQLAVFVFQASQPLSERSGKKAQYEKGKRILRERQYDAGIFIFYDAQGNFRFSLIYANYLGKRRDWSVFRRFTYFVNREFTNKTFLQRIGDGDFSSIVQIKEAFSVEPVTKQFYGELQNWYFWAMDKITFPDDYKYSNDTTKDKEIRNATNLIRLITRIIFIRFLTEKGLIPPELFSREKLERIIKEFMKDKKTSNFYNAILQNLFFGTLNQKMDERKFAQESGFPANKKEYGVKNLYRYGDKFLINFLINKDEILKLFKDIPFLNGGLFDCLDKEDEHGKVVYIDGFSRNSEKQAMIPDYLFFQDQEERVSLSNYGLGASKPVRGLIEILNSYNFTIDENTPVDQEIALDPELLGKVFENLLASYNPETATTARKATGSYYTPREIVDYMVEESLFEYLKDKLSEIEEEKIRILLSYSEEIPEFSEPERQKIISAIDNIKILDPACGSGAFPMGILHKLVYALQKLDPKNKYWHELQYQKALKESEEVFKQNNKYEREERLKEINETFDESINYSDYARKLYLIENCIYGVDIQPIAIQISKLRFFISLVLDQKVDRNKENFGVRALPNLETKFVAANTLIGIEKPQHLFYTDKVKKLEDEIKILRRRYFQAKTRKEKLGYQKKDRELRKQLADELKSTGFSSESSEKIASFDLFDQNASANWFDSEWMFGIKDGFDIVIANPPYVNIEEIDSKLKPIYSRFYTAYQKYDLYILFFEKGLELVKHKGNLIFITSNKYFSQGYGLKLRQLFLKNQITKIINFNYDVFESSVVRTAIIQVVKQNVKSDNYIAIMDINTQKEADKFFKQQYNYIKQEIFDQPEENNFRINLTNEKIKILEKIEQNCLQVYDICSVNYGLRPSSEKLDLKKKFFIYQTREKPHFKKYFEGKDMGYWFIKNYAYLDYRPNVMYNPMFAELFENEKLVGLRTLSDIFKLRFIYDNQGFYCNDSVVILTLWHKLEGVEYSTIKRTISKEKIETSKQFSYQYLQAILNSRLVKFYVNELLYDGTHFYPNHMKILPIKKIQKSDQKPFINLVDTILSIHEQYGYPLSDGASAKVKELERQIDETVYKLYDLIEEEIKIVEGAGN